MYVLDFFAAFTTMICLSFRGGFDILFRNQAQRRSWAEIYNIIWEIQVKLIFRVSRSDSLKKGEWIESDRVESKSS